MNAETIAVNLLVSIYHRVTALVVFGPDGEPLSVCLFDTEFGAFPEVDDAHAREIWLMSNHPEGDTALYPADWAHITRIRATHPGVYLRVFLTNEDFICREVVFSPV